MVTVLMIPPAVTVLTMDEVGSSSSVSVEVVASSVVDVSSSVSVVDVDVDVDDDDDGPCVPEGAMLMRETYPNRLGPPHISSGQAGHGSSQDETSS